MCEVHCQPPELGPTRIASSILTFDNPATPFPTPFSLDWFFFFFCENPQSEISRQHRTHRPAWPKRPMACPVPRRVASHSKSSSLDSAPTMTNILVESRRNSAFVADEAGSVASSTMKTRRWPRSNPASAASKYNTYDTVVKGAIALSTPTSTVVITARRGPASFPRLKPPQAESTTTTTIDSENESSRSATRSAHVSNTFVENGDGADGNDLERGCGGELEGRPGEASGVRDGMLAAGSAPALRCQ